MRLNGASEIIHKKSTSNTLSMEQMMYLETNGLVNFKERDRHREFSLGVEELLMMLPNTIFTNGNAYSLTVWVSVFGVLHIGYTRPFLNEGVMLKDVLISIGLDDVKPRYTPNEYSNFVDVVFEMVKYIVVNYNNEFDEYREKLRHAVDAM